MIVLPTAIREAIFERAREGSPEEICGVLGGTYEPDGTSRVHSQYPADNVAENPRTRYEIDPEQQLAIFDRLEARGEEIVGFYHSHPRGPARPSDTDAALATWPDRSYLIGSLEPHEIGSWRWRARVDRDGADADGRFERERLVVD
ncbi:desampylase [Natrinema hispanicum]|uniref:Proteasome lid subunit RPN8/RPN11, contains Jab1/MPN metalloenzyme (JAMM) motif n=1 Tax=Natrinema hispanicum TaxID=392421 RepID=A0A1G6I4A1_9EURY|nr:desampylase [Natrinema hispanicum]SDC00885.1 Proteasome lid subunit RPN8/RPN11, contains Jab1/MPN metalloenzyme (JAMM) motif [Natrinema hispanicum]SES89077.1 Proteasome lid subunit RPN8/RPN11, contains Jab1/MPN metalloenzyme (JAMM) motif [Natrinema hispanicum]